MNTVLLNINNTDVENTNCANGNLYSSVMDLLQYNEQQEIRESAERVTQIIDEKMSAIDWNLLENKINNIIS